MSAKRNGHPVTSGTTEPTERLRRIEVAEIRRRHSAAASAMRGHPICRAWTRGRTGRAVRSALDCLPAACIEIERQQARTAAAQRRHQNLAAAARASIAAAVDGEPDPFYYVRDELTAQGYFPDDHAGRLA